MNSLYDVLIIGGGPAGVAGGIYAARKHLKTAFVTDTFGGQSIDSADVQNWVGTISISGFDLAQNLKAHLKAYADSVVDIMEGERVVSVEKTADGFVSTTKKGTKINSKTILATPGSTRRKLEVPGAKELEHRGITYCASCDGPFFADQDVVVVGGGNAAFETAAQLLAYAKSVTLLSRSPYRADPVTVKKVLSHANMKTVSGVEILEVKGTEKVESIVYKNTATGETITLPTGGIFVEIGLIPSTDFLKNIVELNDRGQIIIDPRTQKTKTDGIWSAGDCTDTLYHQNNIAAGDAVRALEDIYLHLHAK